MTTVKKAVAMIVATQSVAANHRIQAACKAHPLSGLSRLRELAVDYREQHPFGICYHFNKRSNRYAFTIGFRLFCKKLAEEAK